MNQVYVQAEAQRKFTRKEIKEMTVEGLGQIGGEQHSWQCIPAESEGTCAIATIDAKSTVL